MSKDEVIASIVIIKDTTATTLQTVQQLIGLTYVHKHTS